MHEFRFCPQCAAPLTAGVHGGAERLACSAVLKPWDFGTGLALADWLRNRRPQ